MRNYLLRLGWGHGDEEIIATEQAIALFELAAVGRSPARFDLAKLTSLNAHYLRERPDAELVELLAAPPGRGWHWRRTTKACAGLAEGMAGLKQRARTLVELAQSAAFYVRRAAPAARREGRKLLDDAARARPRRARRRLARLRRLERAGAGGVCRAQAEAIGIGFGKLAQPLRAGADRQHGVAWRLRDHARARAGRGAGAHRGRGDRTQSCIAASRLRQNPTGILVIVRGWQCAGRMLQPHQEGSTMTDQATTKPATLSAGEAANGGLPGAPGHARPGRDRRPQALRPDRDVHLRSRLHLDRELQLEDHLHRRRRGHPAASRLHDRGSGQEQLVPRGRLPDPERRAAEPGRVRRVHERCDLPHHAARADPVPVPRLPPRRAPDGGDDRRRRRAVGLLLRGPARPTTSFTARSRPTG